MRSTNPHKQVTGVRRIVRAAGTSAAGLSAAYREEAAFRQEVWLAAALLPAAFWLGRDGLQVVLLIVALALVLIVELLNSALEATIDRISLELHPLAKRAKDYGSAAVSLALAACAAVWLAVAWQRWMGT